MLTTKNSTDEIRAALNEAGHKASKKMERFALIRMAEQAKLWLVDAGSVVPDSYKTEYGPDQNCGDDVAGALKDEDPYLVAKANGIDADEKWGSGRIARDKKPLNPGMVRMNLGNVLRGRIKRGEYVTIGEFAYNEETKVA